MNKKSQSAMEFLMTYGWALLVVIVVIAALAYFGILNPSRFLPDKVEVGPGIGVIGASADENSLELILKNEQGVTIRNVQLNITECNNGAGQLTEPVTIAPGKSKKIIIDCRDSSAIPNTKFNSDITVNYTSRVPGVKEVIVHKRKGIMQLGINKGNTSVWCNGADFNKDGNVDVTDLGLVATYYGRDDCSPANYWCEYADINRNNSVGPEDNAVVSANLGRSDCTG